jgi:hypothetical protein
VGRKGGSLEKIHLGEVEVVEAELLLHTGFILTCDCSTRVGLGRRERKMYIYIYVFIYVYVYTYTSGCLWCRPTI